MAEARHCDSAERAGMARGDLGHGVKTAFARSIRLALAIGGLLAVAAASAPPSKAQATDEVAGWVRIESAESRLVFHAARHYGDRLPNAARRHVPADGPPTAEGAFWAPANKSEPMAGLYYGALTPAGIDPAARASAAFTDLFHFRREGAVVPLNIVAGGEADTPFGPIAYDLFSLDGRGCLGFLHHLKQGDVGASSSRNDNDSGVFSGFYCLETGRDMSPRLARLVMASAGVEGVAAPLLLPRGRPLPFVLRHVKGTPAELERGILYIDADLPTAESAGVDDAGTAGSGKGDGGALTAVFDRDGMHCRGEWRYEGGSYDADDNPVKGRWRLECPDGREYAGDFVSPAPYRGLATGTDAEGAEVEITPDGALEQGSTEKKE